MLIFWYIHQIIGSKPKSLTEVAKMVSEGRNQASTATTNLLSFSQWSNKTNIQIFKITISWYTKGHVGRYQQLSVHEIRVATFLRD